MTSRTRILPKTAFGIYLVGDKLHVPQEVMEAAGLGNARDVKRLLSCLHSFPTAFMVRLKLDEPQFRQALDELKELLKGLVEDELLQHREPTQEHGTGVGSNHIVKT